MRLILLIFVGALVSATNSPSQTRSTSPCRAADDTSASYARWFNSTLVTADSAIRSMSGITAVPATPVLVADSLTCHLALASFNAFAASFDSAQIKSQIYLFHASPYYLIPNAPRTTGAIFTVVLDSNFAFISGLESGH